MQQRAPSSEWLPSRWVELLCSQSELCSWDFHIITFFGITEPGVQKLSLSIGYALKPNARFPRHIYENKAKDASFPEYDLSFTGKHWIHTEEQISEHEPWHDQLIQCNRSITNTVICQTVRVKSGPCEPRLLSRLLSGCERWRWSCFWFPIHGTWLTWEELGAFFK